MVLHAAGPLASPCCCRPLLLPAPAVASPCCCQPLLSSALHPAAAIFACCRAPCQSQGTGQAPAGSAAGRAGLEGSQQLLPTKPGRRQAPSRCHPAGRATARRHDVVLDPAVHALLVSVQPCKRALHQARSISTPHGTACLLPCTVLWLSVFWLCCAAELCPACLQELAAQELVREHAPPPLPRGGHVCSQLQGAP